MTFGQIASVMYPYWIVGFLIFVATYKSKYKNLLRIEKPAIWNFCKFLVLLAIYRIFVFKMFANADIVKNAGYAVDMLPILAPISVWWEDCAHGLVLLLARNVIGTKWWTWPIHGLLTIVLMIEFGMGHLYQGLLAALVISLYVPYSVRLGKKYGFGTVMICHMLFDFTTIVTVKLLTGM